MSQFYAGVFGDLTFDGKVMHTSNWEFTDDAADVETTTKQSGGFYDSISGKKKGSGTFDAPFDGDLDLDDPPVIRAGSIGSATFYIEEESGGPKIVCTKVRITSCKYSHGLDGAFNYSASFVTNGSYKIPNES